MSGMGMVPVLGKLGSKVNVVGKIFTHVCKCKVTPVETVPGMGLGEVKEGTGRGEFKSDVFDTL
jgi:hypothetical protein